MSTTYKLITTTFPREEHSLKTGAYRLGSAADNEIVIEDASVAAHHCELVVTANTMMLRNLSPKHETFVNDQKIDSAQLTSGQSIRMGDVKLLLEAETTDSGAVGKASEPIRIAAASIAKAKQGLSKPIVRAALLVFGLLGIAALLFTFWPWKEGGFGFSKSEGSAEENAVADSEGSHTKPDVEPANAGRSTLADGGAERALQNLKEQPNAFNPNDTNRPPNVDVEAAEVHIQGESPRLAAPFLQRALRNAESARGAGSPAATKVLSALGNLYRSLREYDKAEPMLEKVLNSAQTASNPEPAEIANAQNNLGELYLASGENSKAAPLLEKALEARKSNLKPDAPEIGVSLNNVAALHASKGDFAKAKPLLEEALKIFEDHFGPDSPSVAQGLNNLGELQRALGDHAAAEPLLERALDIKGKALPPDDASLAATLNSLAAAHSAQGEFKEAEPLLERALSITEKAAGPDHPDTAASLDNLAGLYKKMGDPAKASPLFDRSIQIAKKSLGTEHPQTVMALRNRAELERCQGDPALGQSLTKEALEHSYKLLGAVTQFASRETRIELLDRFTPCDLAVALGSGRDTAEAVLRYKGLIVDSLLEDSLISRAGEVAKTEGMVRALEETKAGLKELLFEVPQDLGTAAVGHRQAELETLLARLEIVGQALGKYLPTLGKPNRALNLKLEDVQGKLGANTALVEFIRYSECHGAEKPKPAYGAVVILPSGEPEWIALGSSEAIEANLSRYQRMIRGIPDGDTAEKLSQDLEPVKGSGDSVETGKQSGASDSSADSSPDSTVELLKQVYGQVWAPVERVLPRGTKSVIISPDGGLNLISFAGLVGADDQFLGEQRLLYYVSAGRDLIAQRKMAENGSVLIFGNPDFTVGSLGGSESPKAAWERIDESARRDLQLLHFPTPIIAAQEIALVHFQASKAKDPTALFMGPRASEAELSAVIGSRVLHLGIRGYVLASTNDHSRASHQDQSGRVEPFYGPAFVKTAAHGILMPESAEHFFGKPRLQNPLHRSGALLAGAEASVKAWKRGQVPVMDNDGIMTAEDLGNLKLEGVGLVVLSACETAAGSIETGDGILVLRRALVQTGAADLLVGLMAKGDDSTAQMIGEFYERYRELGDAPLAFAEVQRKWLTKLRAEQGLRSAVSSVGSFMLNASGTNR
ncbi:MAG: tetratricopeptide repeat protein [Verrucomicrobia bacterium]|nr:tetratricopeptide repeat protein [Verrucomicrobiota bacterium]